MGRAGELYMKADLPLGNGTQSPAEFARILLFQSGQPLSLSYGQVPLAGWSEGARAAALFGRGEAVPCEVRPKGPRLCRSPLTAPGEPPISPTGKYLTCAAELGTCQPGTVGLSLPCDVATNAGCTVGETCEPSATGFCIDPTSSRLAGNPADRAFAVVHEQVVGVEHDGSSYRTTTATGETFLSKRLVVGIGTSPRIPGPLRGIGVHSADYLAHKADLQQQRTITIVGSGQSAAEIYFDLLSDAPAHDYELVWLTREIR